VRRCATLLAGLLTIAGPGRVAAQAEAEAARLLAEARARAEAGEEDAAITAWEDVARQWPDTEAAAEALLLAARSRFQRGEVAEAATAAQRVLERDPQAPRAAAAQILLAEISWAGAAGREMGEEALAAFHRVWALFPESTYPDLEWRAAARVREGQLEAALGRPERALGAYLDVIEREPPSAWRVRAHRLLAEAFFDQGEWAAAVTSLQGAVADAERLEGEAARREGDTARRRLAALDRLVLRPLAGLGPWAEATPVSGLQLAKPQAVAVSDDGRLAVADGGANVALIQLGDGSVRRIELRGMERPAWSGDQAWVPADGGFVTAGQAPRALRGSGDPPKVLLAAAPVPFGWAMVTARPDQAVLASSELRVQRALALPERSEPIDIAADAQGRVMVLDGRGQRVVLFDSPEAPARSILEGQLDRPQALAVGSLGHLFVLERGGRVVVADREGRVIATVGPTLPGGSVLGEPRDLSVDGAGRLFVSDAKLGSVLVLE
jgi:tetratricopeptide (TPR) repeat protein